jgi:hypothetical protein
MKILITNYTFNAASRTVTFLGYSRILLDSVLLITNVTDNVIIYNFAGSGKGGTVSGNVLTLDFDTTTMSNGDSLQIYYDDEAIVPATVQEQQNTEDLLYLLSVQGNALGKLAEMVDGANIRAALQASAAVIGAVTQNGSWTLTTVTTVSTVTTCSTLTNQAQNGGQPTNDIVPNASNTLATLANINNVVYAP